MDYSIIVYSFTFFAIILLFAVPFFMIKKNRVKKEFETLKHEREKDKKKLQELINQKATLESTIVQVSTSTKRLENEIIVLKYKIEVEKRKLEDNKAQQYGNEKTLQEQITLLEKQKEKALENLQKMTEEARRSLSPKPLNIESKIPIDNPVNTSNKKLSTDPVPVSAHKLQTSSIPKYPLDSEVIEVGIKEIKDNFVDYDLSKNEITNSYPILRFPKKGTIVRSYDLGKRKRRGFKEKSFQKSIKHFFGEDFAVLGDAKLMIGKGIRPYEPDIAIVEKENSETLRIDIEIDEPYTGVTRQATHCRGEDINRDNYFIDRGWIVIRFSEHQVHLFENECLLFVAEVIRSAVTRYKTPIQLIKQSSLQVENLWDIIQAQKWEKAKYREEYLNHIFLPTEEENEIVEEDLNEQQYREESLVKSSLNVFPDPMILKSSLPVELHNNKIEKTPSTNYMGVTNKLSALSELQLIPYRKKDKWGFCRPDKEIMIKCEYDEVKTISNNLLWVSKDYKDGLIKWNNNYYEEPAFYDYCSNHQSNEIIVLKKNDKYGLIDNFGNTINNFNLNYDNIGYFKEGLASVKRRISDKSYLTSFNDNCKKDNYIPDIEHVLAVIEKSINEEVSLNGFIDKSGIEVIPCVYEKAYDFSEGLAPVRFNNKWGFIDWKGKVLLNNVYDAAWGFKNGLALVCINNKYGVINHDGIFILQCIYDDITFDHENNVIIFKLNSKYGFYNSQNKFHSKCHYSTFSYFHEGLAQVSINNKNGYIDLYGNEVISPIYNETTKFSEGLALVGLTNEHFFINQEGERVISIPEVEWVHSKDLFQYNGFSEGLAKVIRNEKFGFIRRDGTEAIPCIYDFVFDFDGDMACVEIGRKFGFIDKFGKQIIPCLYRSFEHDFSVIYQYQPKWQNNLLPVYVAEGGGSEYGRLIGYIDKKGNEYWED